MKGRMLTLEYESFFLVNVDKPNVGFDLTNLKFKT